jgi:NADPH:quinone reductase-like Zn-dependent oxidoreductase
VAIQLAKVWGAYVVTTASASNEKFLKVLRRGSEHESSNRLRPGDVHVISR